MNHRLIGKIPFEIFAHDLHDNVIGLIKIVRIYFHGRYILPAFADSIEIHKIKYLNRDIVCGTNDKLLMKHYIDITIWIFLVIFLI